MERTRNRLALLLELTAGLAERMELQSIAQFVLGVGRTAIQSNRATLCVVTTDKCFLDVVAHVGYDEEMMGSWSRFAVNAPLPASDAVRRHAAVYLRSPQERAERYPMFADIGGDGASAMLPLLGGGEALGALVFGFDGERDFDNDDRSFLNAVAGHCAIALDRARLYEAALRRQANLTLLADSSAVLARAGDNLEEALQRLAALAAPTIADIASFHLLDSPNAERLAARTFSNEAMLVATERVSDYGADLAATAGLGGVLRTGEEATWDDADRFIDQIARSDEHRQALLAMDLGAGIIVPMLAQGRVLGAGVFANHGEREMTVEDRQLARNLTERAGVLLDNARLMRQHADISHGLQAALLPSSLPNIPGFELAARYQPAGAGMEVGGDFYDVILAGDGYWLLVVGDVTGHGVEAAAATGLVRHTIRSAAMIGMPAPEILEHVNRALLSRPSSLPPGTFCTVALAALTIDDTIGLAHVSVSCAGHPPPLLRRTDGTVEQLAARGRLLGYFDTIEAETTTIGISDGDTLVAFTDGVIERHDERNWFQDHDLIDLVAKNDVDADTLAAVIRETAVEAFTTPPTDDMAILVLRKQPFNHTGKWPH